MLQGFYFSNSLGNFKLESHLATDNISVNNHSKLHIIIKETINVIYLIIIIIK